MNNIALLLLGLMLRIGLPLAVMAALVIFLRHLDETWKREAPQSAYRLQPGQKPCWEQKDCSLQTMRACPAVNSLQPCWQARREPDGNLQPACLECGVFRSAPVPMPIKDVHI